MEIFDTTPHRRRLRSFRGVGRTPIILEASPTTLAAGALATAIGLATLVALAAPPLGLAATLGPDWAVAYDEVKVPVMPGSKVSVVHLMPSIALMILPVAGTFIASLGFVARRTRGLPIGPAVGMVTCTLAVACWWLYFVWMALAHGGQADIRPWP